MNVNDLLVNVVNIILIHTNAADWNFTFYFFGLWIGFAASEHDFC